MIWYTKERESERCLRHCIGGRGLNIKDAKERRYTHTVLRDRKEAYFFHSLFFSALSPFLSLHFISSFLFTIYIIFVFNSKTKSSNPCLSLRRLASFLRDLNILFTTFYSFYDSFESSIFMLIQNNAPQYSALVLQHLFFEYHSWGTHNSSNRLWFRWSW